MKKAGSFWAARTILSAMALVTSSLFLAGCGRSVASPTCSMKALVAAAGKGYLKLPPSHDNDAGRGRIPDARPTRTWTPTNERRFARSSRVRRTYPVDDVVARVMVRLRRRELTRHELSTLSCR